MICIIVILNILVIKKTPCMFYTILSESPPIFHIHVIIISVNTHSSHNGITFQGYSELDVHVIDLVQDQCHGQFEEAKISSSSLRKRLLGTLFNPVKVFAKLFMKWTEWLPNSYMSLDCLSFEIRGWFLIKCRFY